MAAAAPYDRAYYAARGCSGGRLALWFYARVARRYAAKGSVLDYGCGGGHLLKYFNRKHYETHGYDTSSDALDLARENAVFARFYSSRQEIPLNSFDVVCAIHVLEHIEEPLETLCFIGKLLKPRGILMYVVPNISGLGAALKKDNWIGFGDPAHVSLLPRLRWLSLTEQAGLRVVATGTDGLWDVPYLGGVPLLLQKIIFYPAPAVQVMTGRLIMPAHWGESLVVVAQDP